MSDEQAMEKMTIIIYPSGKVSIQLPKTHEENVTCLLGVNDAKFQATCQAPHRTVIAYMDHAYINVDSLKWWVCGKDIEIRHQSHPIRMPYTREESLVTAESPLQWMGFGVDDRRMVIFSILCSSPQCGHDCEIHALMLFRWHILSGNKTFLKQNAKI